jgi:hypothetical protein
VLLTYQPSVLRDGGASAAPQVNAEIFQDQEYRIKLPVITNDKGGMRFFVYCVLLAMTSILAPAADSSDKLGKVKSIFVAPLEGQNQPVSEMLREKLIGSLVKISGIVIVDDESNADAILTFTGVEQTLPTEYGHIRYLIQGGVRLTTKDDGIVLWAENVSSSRFARSASTSFADNVAKSLGRALTGHQH